MNKLKFNLDAIKENQGLYTIKNEDGSYSFVNQDKPSSGGTYSGTSPIKIDGNVISFESASFNPTSKSIQYDLSDEVSYIKFRDNTSGTPNTIFNIVPVSAGSNGAQILNGPINEKDIVNKKYSDTKIGSYGIKNGSIPEDKQIIIFDKPSNEFIYGGQSVIANQTVEYEYIDDKSNWIKDTDNDGVIVRNEVLPDNCLGVYLKYFDNSDSNNVIEIVGLCSNIKGISTSQPSNNESAIIGGFFGMFNDNKSIGLNDVKGQDITVDISKLRDLWIYVPSGTPAPSLKNTGIVKRTATPSTESINIVNQEIVADLAPLGTNPTIKVQNPISDTDGTIGLKIAPIYFKIDTDNGSLTINSAGINGLILTYLGTDIGKKIITDIILNWNKSAEGMKSILDVSNTQLAGIDIKIT